MRLHASPIQGEHHVVDGAHPGVLHPTGRMVRAPQKAWRWRTANKHVVGEHWPKALKWLKCERRFRVRQGMDEASSVGIVGVGLYYILFDYTCV